MTKRKISNKIDRLEEERGHDDGQFTLLNLAGVAPPEGKAWPDKEDSTHPELVVQPWPERKPREITIAVPSYLPDRYSTADILIVYSCDGMCSPRDDDRGATVNACELWEEMSDEQLHLEYEYRVENGEQVPDLLADHVDDDRDGEETET
jgi:hypothetical protein